MPPTPPPSPHVYLLELDEVDQLSATFVNTAPGAPAVSSELRLPRATWTEMHRPSQLRLAISVGWETP